MIEIKDQGVCFTTVYARVSGEVFPDKITRSLLETWGTPFGRGQVSGLVLLIVILGILF